MDAARKAARFYGTQKPERREDNLVSTPMCKTFLLFQSYFVQAKPSFYKPMIVTTMLHLSQQLSGINTVMYYSTSIFNSAGVRNAGLATVFVGLISMVFTFIRYSKSNS